MIMLHLRFGKKSGRNMFLPGQFKTVKPQYELLMAETCQLWLSVLQTLKDNNKMQAFDS